MEEKSANLTKEPTKDEFMTAMLKFSTNIMMKLIDGKITKEEYESLALDFVNIGVELYGIPYKLIKVMPKICGIPTLHI